jgi:hypothetical protein
LEVISLIRTDTRLHKLTVPPKAVSQRRIDCAPHSSGVDVNQILLHVSPTAQQSLLAHQVCRFRLVNFRLLRMKLGKKAAHSDAFIRYFSRVIVSIVCLKYRLDTHMPKEMDELSAVEYVRDRA